MSIQSLDALGRVMFLADLTVVTDAATSAVIPGQRLDVDTSLMVLGMAAAAGLRAYQTALETTN